MDRDTGEIEVLVEIGERQAPAVLLERRRIARRHNLFHRVDRPSSPSSTSRARSSRPAATAACSAATPTARSSTRARRPVLRQRPDPDRGRVGAGVRRDPGPPAVQVLADRAEGRNRHAAGGEPARHAGQPVDGQPTAGSGARWCRRATPRRTWLAPRSPRLRKLLWRLPDKLQPQIEPMVWAVAFDPDTGAAVAGVHMKHPDFGARHRPGGARRPAVAGHASGYAAVAHCPLRRKTRR